MGSSILRRIEAQASLPGLADALIERIAPSDLQSLLMEVMRERARQADAARVRQRGDAPLCKPSATSARLLNMFDRIAYEAASEFDAIEVPPVNPLGTNHVLGGIDPHNMLTTIRNVEVLGDTTPAMALEAARRRSRPADRANDVRLCASHRCVRLQPVDVPGFTPHFRLFAAVSAGRDTGSYAFELQHLTEHIRLYLDLFRGLNQAGFSLQRPLVEVGDMAIVEALLGDAAADARAAVRAHWFGSGDRFLAEHGISLESLDNIPASLRERVGAVQERVFGALTPAYPEAEFRFATSRLEGLGYYNGLCLRISPEAPDGRRYSIADGGFTDWTARLLNDRKERLLTSGIGSEFACKMYQP